MARAFDGVWGRFEGAGKFRDMLKIELENLAG